MQIRTDLKRSQIELLILRPEHSFRLKNLISSDLKHAPPLLHMIRNLDRISIQVLLLLVQTREGNSAGIAVIHYEF